MSTAKNKNVLRAFLPVIGVFIIVNSFLLAAAGLLGRWDIDRDVLLVGNLILFLATCVSFYFYNKSLQNNNVHVIMRMVYAGMFIKLLLCLVTSFIYISTAGKQVNKGAIFGCMLLYFVYTFFEVAVLMKISKQNKNA